MTGEQKDNSAHAEPHECTNAHTIEFDDEHVFQGGKIALNGECTVCGRRFERVWLHSHDQCLDPEYQEVAIKPRPY